MLKTLRNYHRGYSLLELVAVATLLGLLAAVIVPRLSSSCDSADASACHVYQGDLEVQVELWLHNTGLMPSSDLSDVGADANYFPVGLPTCPVNGTTYTIDTSTGLVIGHTH